MENLRNERNDNSDKSKKIKKCPNCGQILNSFEAKCIACGYEIRNNENF